MILYTTCKKDAKPYNQPPGQERRVAKHYFVVAPTFSGSLRTYADLGRMNIVQDKVC